MSSNKTNVKDFLSFTREETASALVTLGYKVDRQWFINLRNEDTPSAKIYPNGVVHDYGDGFHGDLIKILRVYHGYGNDAYGAINNAKELVGKETNIDFTKFDTSSNKINNNPLPDDFMIPHRIDARNYRQAYLAELKQLFLGEYKGKKMLSANWNKVLEIAARYDISYNNKSGRLIMPIRDTDGKIRTFWKYKKNGEDFVKDDRTYKHRKVLYTKNRSRPPFAITDMLEFRKTPGVPIVICEGEKDALVSNTNGLRAICIGGAGASKCLHEKYLDLFKGLNIIIAGDYDDAGYKFNKNLLAQLKPIAKSVTILRWEKKAKEDGFELHKKFDLADYFAWKNNNGDLK
ncbi:toprim domain-containing protein [Sulfurimonas sp.]|uniref:toprim domain-containing protein n=1 Tax=Sulfurimonas sp. TaxID=2022749 RepID=UPI0025E82C46|nr:toprim domain-containing protein [Sulfurimonas sp.]